MPVGGMKPAGGTPAGAAQVAGAGAELVVARSVDEVDADVAVAVTRAEEAPLAIADEVPRVAERVDDVTSRDELRALDEVGEPRTLDSAALEPLRVELVVRLVDAAVDVALDAREEPARVPVGLPLAAGDPLDAPADATDAATLPLRSPPLDEATTAAEDAWVAAAPATQSPSISSASSAEAHAGPP